MLICSDKTTMKNKVNIKDIAKQLGVSASLVSFVLNGKSKEMRISDEMTSRVLEYVKNTNYKPNYNAKSLRTGKNRTIGLIIADISNPFFAQLARFIESEASKRNYRVIFSSSDEQNEKFASQLEFLKYGQVDGFILTPPIGSEKELLILSEQKIPFVLVDRIFNNVDAHSIIIDNYNAAYSATMRLIAMKRKNIALLNVNNELITMQDRTKGYTDALLASGLEINTALVKHLKFSHQKKLVMKSIKEVIDSGAEGILFTTNKLGVTGIECIHELDLRIPENLAIVSFDDADVYKISSISISAIQQPLKEMSKEAVRILVNTIENPSDHREFEKIKLKVKYIMRKSCAS
jgi:LacI family transcriptional regulator